MVNRQKIVEDLQKEVSVSFNQAIKSKKKELKNECKIKSKHLPQEEQKEIINEMRKSYFEPFQQSGLMPSLVKFTDANFRDYLSEYSDEGLAGRMEDPARRRDLINKIVKYFHFAEMHEFFNKLKADLDKDHEEATVDTKNQILSKNQVQRTKDDKFTSLTAKQTGLLLKVLQEYQVLLGEGYLTKEDMYRIAQVTTGYGRDLVKKGYNKQEIADTDSIAVAKVLKNMADQLLKDVS